MLPPFLGPNPWSRWTTTLPTRPRYVRSDLSLQSPWCGGPRSRPTSSPTLSPSTTQPDPSTTRSSSSSALTSTTMSPPGVGMFVNARCDPPPTTSPHCSGTVAAQSPPPPRRPPCYVSIPCTNASTGTCPSRTTFPAPVIRWRTTRLACCIYPISPFSLTSTPTIHRPGPGTSTATHGT
jgi:hypothetical protein